MSVITGLIPQKRDQNRINVFLDGSFAFGLSRITVAWLKVGQELSEEEIRVLCDRDEHEKALQSALRYIGLRNHSEYEVTKKLNEKGFSRKIIEEVLDDLKKRDYLGDFLFAKEWVENRIATKPRGRKLLIYELKQKRVGDDEIQIAIEGLPEEEELALKAIKKVSSRIANLDRNEFRKKVSEYLFRRGFNFDVINKISDSLWKENEQNKFKEIEG